MAVFDSFIWVVLVLKEKEKELVIGLLLVKQLKDLR
jgi:hypothetical protein